MRLLLPYNLSITIKNQNNMKKLTTAQVQTVIGGGLQLN
jgi:hypothetical protein